MKTFIVYTLCAQKITVRNCANYAEALQKLDLKPNEIFKVVEVRS